tara:strand:- start:322 stop:540 length:219 start_codon:yes stop_codon:yes gene_type:complete
MKIGDLVKPTHDSPLLGVVVRVFMHKLWETDKLGKRVDWDRVEEEPFAEVLWNGKGMYIKIPQRALEVVREV